MGRWRWLNWALLAVAAVYGAWFVLGRTEGSFAGSPSEEWRKADTLQAASSGIELLVHRNRERLRLRVPRNSWPKLKSACLQKRAETCFEGGRHSFELTLPGGTLPAGLLLIRLESWTGEERSLAFRLPD